MRKKIIRLTLTFTILISLCININALDIPLINIEKNLQYEIVRLDGQWLFIPDKFIKSEFEMEENSFLINVPGSWESELRGYQYGYGTYIINVELNQYEENLSLFFDENIQALSIYVNGKHIANSGRISKNQFDGSPGRTLEPVNFSVESNKFTIYIHASNWDHREGGLVLPITLSSQNRMANNYRMHFFLESFVSGLAFSISLFYILFFIVRRSEIKSLYFSGLSFALGLRVLTTGVSVFDTLFHHFSVNLLLKIEYLSFIFAVMLFIRYIFILYSNYSHQKAELWIQFPGIVFALMVIFLPLKIITNYILWFNLYAFIISLYIIYILIRSSKIYITGRVLFISYSILLLTMISDMLFYSGIISLGPITWIGISVFLFSQVYVLMYQHARSLLGLEKITNEYREANIVLKKTKLEIEEQNEKLNKMAFFDQLTALPNRFNLINFLERDLKRANRNDEIIVLLFMDIDNYKIVNESYGTEAGDELLCEFSKRLIETFRESDTIFRLGGDEFAVLLGGVKKLDDVVSITNKLEENIRIPLKTKVNKFFLTASIGVVSYPKDGSTIESLLKNSEIAMYRAKSEGGNKTVFYTEEIDKSSREKIDIEAKIRDAISNNHFQLYYQPQIDGSNNRLNGFEALIRWIDPENGVIPPNKFIPIAEENGLIVQIGQWVIEETCRQVSKWISEGHKDFHVSINVSAQQFYRDDFVPILNQAIIDNEIDTSYISLELTESMMVSNPKATGEKMNEIKNLGVKLMIDDFGTGYSSLSYLKYFPLDVIKIDGAFTKDIVNDSFNKKLCLSIISLAKNLDMGLIAEGVETEEEKHYLIQQGCNIIQGYLYSKPIPAEDVYKHFNRKEEL